MLLAALYTLRVIAGGRRGRIPASFWLLAFPCSYFSAWRSASATPSYRLTATRRADRRRARLACRRPAAVKAWGTAAGLACVLVLALYHRQRPGANASTPRPRRSGSFVRCCSTGSADFGSRPIVARCMTIQWSLRCATDEPADRRARRRHRPLGHRRDRPSDTATRVLGPLPAGDASAVTRLTDRRRAVAPATRPRLVYGNGRSYGDVCLNDGGEVLLARGLDRFIAFDPVNGVLRAEAGVLLSEVLALVVPRGWFLASPPAPASSPWAGP